MFEEIDVNEPIGLDDYESEDHLSADVAALRAEAAGLAPRLAGRTVWMVNSTSQGGGVAEMMPKLVSLLGEVGVRCRWGVIRSDRAAFFALTKRIHNMLHGQEGGSLDAQDRALFECVNRRNGNDLRGMLAPGDIVVIHDPQPLALGAFLKAEHGVITIFRSHIGLERETPSTEAAWAFLKPYAAVVFTADAYAPSFLASRAVTIRPSIDPWSHKNRDLTPHKLMGVLCNAGLQRAAQPMVTPPFDHQAMRMGNAEGHPSVDAIEDIGLLYRPIVTQVSRWDRLKGFHPLLLAFVRLKERRMRGAILPGDRHARRIELLRLVLAGPDPSSIQDDPDAQDVLHSLTTSYAKLSPELRRDIAIISLPMQSRKENALIVNAIQRCSTLIVQNSIEEGFGLTATEAMWKRGTVLGTRAYGLCCQIRDGMDGLLTKNPEDPEEIANHLDMLLSDGARRELMGNAAQRRVHAESLVFSQVAAWLRLFTRCIHS
ncbi:MAG: glycosyltransferase [Polyangiaceae bacterium]|nr:glycosyltransferase [Polyangiaceae bacterium]